MDQRVQTVIALMEAAIRRELPARELARSVNLSPWRLCHLFKAEVGTSPTQYLKRIRMENAQHLLMNTFLSVKEIMTSVGINDQSHFVRDFKKIFGTTPAEYRKRHALIEGMATRRAGLANK